MIKFNATKKELILISKIANRAIVMAKDMGIEYKKLAAVMDIEATHCNGNPLKLADLLRADDNNFRHDVLGIRRYIDRRTGKLTECFVPRFSEAI